MGETAEISAMELMDQCRSSILYCQQLEREIENMGTTGAPMGSKSSNIQQQITTNMPDFAEIQMVSNMEAILAEEKSHYAVLFSKAHAILHASLPSKEDSAMHYFYLFAQEIPKICQIMNCSEFSLRNLLSSARKKLEGL